MNCHNVLVILVIAVLSNLVTGKPLREIQDESFLLQDAANVENIAELDKREISLAQDLSKLFAAKDTVKVQNLLSTIESVRNAADIVSQSNRGKSNKVERAVIETLREFFGKIGRRLINNEEANVQLELLPTSNFTVTVSASQASPTTKMISTTSAPTTTNNPATTNFPTTTSIPATTNSPTPLQPETTSFPPLTDIEPTFEIVTAQPRPRFGFKYILKLILKLVKRFHRPPTYPTIPPAPTNPPFFGGFNFSPFRRFRRPRLFFSYFSRRRMTTSSPPYRFGGFDWDDQ